MVELLPPETRPSLGMSPHPERTTKSGINYQVGVLLSLVVPVWQRGDYVKL